MLAATANPFSMHRRFMYTDRSFIDFGNDVVCMEAEKQQAEKEVRPFIFQTLGSAKVTRQF